jgi:hypothetical protein
MQTPSKPDPSETTYQFHQSRFVPFIILLVPTVLVATVAYGYLATRGQTTSPSTATMSTAQVIAAMIFGFILFGIVALLYTLPKITITAAGMLRYRRGYGFTSAVSLVELSSIEAQRQWLSVGFRLLVRVWCLKLTDTQGNVLTFTLAKWVNSDQLKQIIARSVAEHSVTANDDAIRLLNLAQATPSLQQS